VKGSQYDDLAFRHLVTNLILRGEYAPDFRDPKRGNRSPSRGCAGNAPEATEKQTYGTSCRAGIDGLQEVVQSMQVRVGRLDPAERHRITAVLSVDRQ
jgi:hypothetical protein